MVVTTGGTSVGRKDHVIRALIGPGMVLFHRVRLRRGKPIGLARLPDHEAVAFAIPGRPVGAYTVALPVMRAFFTGERTTVTMKVTIDRTATLGPDEYAIPVAMATDNGSRHAMLRGHIDVSLRVCDKQFDPSVPPRVHGRVERMGSLSRIQQPNRVIASPSFPVS